jgi:hypothetical protein
VWVSAVGAAGCGGLLFVLFGLGHNALHHRLGPWKYVMDLSLLAHYDQSESCRRMKATRLQGGRY